MIKVIIIVDGFQVGLMSVKKGKQFETNQKVADYLVANNKARYMTEEELTPEPPAPEPPAPEPPKVARKKSARKKSATKDNTGNQGYERRDIVAKDQE